MSRLLPKKLIRIPVVPAFPRSPIQASPRRPAPPGAVPRVSWLRPGRNGVVPRRLLCAAAMVASTVGCESTIPAVVEDTALVTDGTSFRFELWGSVRGNPWYSAEIPYSFTNRTGSKVFIPTCSGGIGLALQMDQAGQWVHVWSPTHTLCLGPPIVIEPGEVYQRILNVVGCLGRNCGSRLVLPPNPSTPIRILWLDALSSYDEDKRPFGKPIPLEERFSNRFTLQVPN